MRPLRQSTAAIRPFGPYADTNGAAVRSLTNITGVFVNNGVTAAATVSLTNVASGYIGSITNANATNAGELVFLANTNAAFIAPKAEYWAVLPTGVYDLFYGTNQTFTNNLLDVGKAASVSGTTGAALSVTGNVGGNVVGSVGSVAGTVGAALSVTGNVGGNVTGSVGSIASGGITAASFASNAITAAKIVDGALSGKGDWVQVRHATISVNSTGANPTVISYLMVADNYISNVLVAGEFTSGDSTGVPFIGFADSFTTITLAYQLPTAFLIGDTFNLWVLGGPKVDPATGVSILTTASYANLANLANADVATSTRMVAGGSAMVGGYSLAPVTPTNLVNAIFTTTNRAFVDSSNRVKTLDSGGNVFTYTAPDNANILVAATNSAALVTRITSTLFSGITSLGNWLRNIAGKGTPDATATTEINTHGTNTGTFDPSTDSNEALRDRGDAAWVTGTGGGTSGTTVNRQVTINEVTKTFR